jgi:hypothetical protein
MRHVWQRTGLFTGFGWVGGNMKDRNRLENLDVDARIVLKRTLNRKGGVKYIHLDQDMGM